MKKIAVVLLSMLALVVGACGQIPGLPLPPTQAGGPTVSPEDQFQTAIAQTLTARASLPPNSVTETATLALSSETATLATTAVIAVTETATVAQTPTQVVGLSPTAVTATGSFATATNPPASVVPTATLATGQVTPIWTLAIRTYGTLPPAVPFSHISLVNKAKTEAYISLQVTMPNGEYSIIEYPVEGRVKIKAPIGSYLYVAWVGGSKMVGEFRLTGNDDKTITLYKDRIVVQ